MCGLLQQTDMKKLATMRALLSDFGGNIEQYQKTLLGLGFVNAAANKCRLEIVKFHSTVLSNSYCINHLVGVK